MRGKKVYYNPKNFKQSHQNQPKCKKNAVKISKSGSANPIPKFEIGVSKPLTLNPKIALKNRVPNPKIGIRKP